MNDIITLLHKNIENLIEIVKKQQERIIELEKQIKDQKIIFDPKDFHKSGSVPLFQPYNFKPYPQNICLYGCIYPNPWLGTFPPACKVCGRTRMSDITCTSSISMNVGKQKEEDLNK